MLIPACHWWRSLWLNWRIHASLIISCSLIYEHAKWNATHMGEKLIQAHRSDADIHTATNLYTLHAERGRGRRDRDKGAKSRFKLELMDLSEDFFEILIFITNFVLFPFAFANWIDFKEKNNTPNIQTFKPSS